MKNSMEIMKARKKVNQLLEFLEDNKRKLILISVPIGTVILIIAGLYAIGGVRLSLKFDNITENIILPSGFKIETFASDLGGSVVSVPGPNPGPRMMLLKDGVLFVTVPSQGRVVALPDTNKDNKADQAITFLDSLNNPHGIDFYNGWFYIAEEDRVIRVKEANNSLVADRDSLQVLTSLPSGSHFTRTLKIFNASLYVSVGSDCNVCIEADWRRASIMKCDLEGKNCATFARGLRNAVGFVFSPTGKMYATENGRDWLGDNTPPDEINLIEGGKDYGWPFCYGKNIHDTGFDHNVYVTNPCQEPFETPSLVDLQAHSAPLGLAFYNGTSFPEEYSGSLFVAFHGSWNRGVATGYKIVNINLNNLTMRDFATGWLQGINVIGRPVDIIVAGDGSLFVSDDNAGSIYRIYYSG